MLAKLALVLAATAAAIPAGISPAAAASSASAGPKDIPAAQVSPALLERRLEKAETALGKAEDAVLGRDPGKVSLLLKRVDDELGIFEVNARLQPLVTAIETARAAARHDDFEAAEAALQRVRALYPPLSDYAVLQQAEESSRAALRAAGGADGATCVAAIDRFEASLRPALLLKRLGEARQAIARTRAAMVRNDLKGGAADLRAARQGLDGLRFAAALSRAQFGLRIGAELLEQQALLGARDQVQKALRGLRIAAELGSSGPDAAELAAARDTVTDVWRRILRPQTGDGRRLLEVAGAVEVIRLRL